MMQVTTSKS